MFSGGLTFLNKEDNDIDNFLSGADSNEKSNLADIFEADELEKPNDMNPTLKYVSLKSKQPQKNSTWNVEIAKIIGAFKLVNDANTSLGQLGLALLKNSDEDASKLILYKTKEQILSTLLLSKSSKVYWKPPYLQYHDDLNGFWSLLFRSDSDSNAFFAKLEEVCIIDRAYLVKSGTNDRKEKVEPTVESTELRNHNVDETDITITSTAKAKSDVVYRVAKIGHQLPKIIPVADDDSDSTLLSDTEKIPSNQPIQSIYNIPEKPTAMATTQIPPKPANISVALQPSFWPASSPFDLNSFAVENRIQHTEVRMHLAKLDSKVDRVLDNIERLRLNSSNPDDAIDKEGDIIRLEEKLLELKKENHLLKLQQTEGNQAKIHKEKDELLALQRSNDEKDLKINELLGIVQELEQNLNTDIKAKDKEKVELIEKYTNELENLRKELEKKKAELEEAQQQQERQGNTTVNGEVIRGIMNQFYIKLYQSIEGKETMTPADFLKLTAEIVRKETKAALTLN